MRESNKRWISAGSSFIIGQQKIGAVLDAVDKISRAIDIANNVDLRKRVIGITKLSEDMLRIKWQDPHTKKEWTEVMSRLDFEAWEEMKNNI